MQSQFTPLVFLFFRDLLLVPGELFAGPVPRGRHPCPSPFLPGLFTLSSSLGALSRLFGGLIAPPLRGFRGPLVRKESYSERLPILRVHFQSFSHVSFRPLGSKEKTTPLEVGE